VGWAIAAILLGLALFGFLRARAVVGETWDVHAPRSFVGVVATVVALAFLIFVSGSLLGVIVGAAVLGVALYGSWRLRRV
jgi:hypothetical protein